jgi:hypothetical protein
LLLVSAGADRMIRVWTGDLEELVAIDLEEAPREIVAVSSTEIAVLTSSGIAVIRFDLDYIPDSRQDD